MLLVLAFACLSGAAAVSIVRWRALLPESVIGRVTYPMDLYLREDGSFTHAKLRRAEPAAKVVFEISRTRDPARTREAFWKANGWKLDVQAVSGTISQTQRAQIAQMLFAQKEEPLDPRALTLAPVPGETWTGATTRTWDYPATTRYLAAGWPGGLAAGAVLLAGAACFAQGKPRAGHCPVCNYDRAGIATDAVCPECGKQP